MIERHRHVVKIEQSLPKKAKKTEYADAYTSQIRDDLYKFQDESPSSPTFRSTLESIMTKLQEHQKELLGHDVAVLEEKISAKESADLVTQLKKTSSFTPTR
jgi:hypothetical protein